MIDKIINKYSTNDSKNIFRHRHAVDQVVEESRSNGTSNAILFDQIAEIEEKERTDLNTNL